MSRDTIPSPTASTTVNANSARRHPETQLDAGERYRRREFGVGYGRSSGYAPNQRYAPSSAGGPFAVR
jgi:hypothetical protein